jgi:4a-hydroxytetrahydrobiopterin dehydratase
MTTATDLAQRHCQPCGAELPPLSSEQVRALLRAVPGWELSGDGRRLRRSWRAKDFMAALDFFNRIAAVAEAEDHHPDLHLTAYRDVAIELWTHAVGGLSENDFILAARISLIPLEEKK